jgi:sarcosine oxidase
MGVGGGYWGHGAPEGDLAKVGPRGAVARGDEPSVDGLDRIFRDLDGAASIDAVERFLPSLDPRVAEGFVCHSTRTPDEQFVLGPLPSMPDVIVAAGESGHGGKHAAGVGDIAAALATDRDPGLDLDFLRPERFALAAAG